MRRTVTAALYARCAELLPGVIADARCRRVLRACILSPRRCRQDPDAIVAGVATLARWAGSPGDLMAGTRLRRRFVKLMAEAGLAVTVGSYSRAQRMARTIRVEWGAEWAEALRADRVAPVEGTSRVVFLTGEAWSRRKAAADLKERRAAVATELEGSTSPARGDAEYLNGLAPNGFAPYSRSADKLLPRVGDPGDAAFVQDPARRRIAELVLGGLAEQAAPVVRPCVNSTRLRSVGASIASLPKEVRAELGRDLLVEYDLQCAQLAIVGKQWGVPQVLALLRGKRSVWSVLLEQLGLPEEAKPCLKLAVYTLCFGGSRPTIARHLVWGDRLRRGETPPDVPKEGLAAVVGPERAETVCRAFFRLGVVRALLSARKRRIAEIRAAGGIEHPDLPGHLLRVRKAESRWDSERRRFVTVRRGRQPHQLLAECAQAVERQIIRAAYDLARDNPREFRIVADLHDGFVVAFSRNQERWERRIIEAVNARAVELGVPTRLCRKSEQPKAEQQPVPVVEAPALPDPPPAPEVPQDVAAAPGPRQWHPRAVQLLEELRAREVARRAQEEPAPPAAPPPPVAPVQLDAAARLAVAREALAEKVARMRQLRGPRKHLGDSVPPQNTPLAVRQRAAPQDAQAFPGALLVRPHGNFEAERRHLCCHAPGGPRCVLRVVPPHEAFTDEGHHLLHGVSHALDGVSQAAVTEGTHDAHHP